MKKLYSERFEFKFYDSTEREPMFLHETFGTLSDDDGEVLTIARVVPGATFILRHLRDGWVVVVDMQKIAEAVMDSQSVRDATGKATAYQAQKSER